jgi:SAM-dependent methyltransferase
MFEYLGRIAPRRKLALDCGTGSGQAAAGLAAVFDCVIATDASENQIANAQSHDRVEYRVAPAENSSLESETIDLLMVAQALHWFELDCFYAEARRILKPQGVLAATAYNLLQISPGIDQVVNRYYYEIVGPFWPAERALVERFTELPFPFPEQNPPSFQMNANWNVEQLLGYLRSWSSTERFIAATNRNPLEQIASELGKAWGDPQRKRRIMWPLVLRVGIKSMAELTKE